MTAAVVAFLADPALEQGLAAGFEEEGVPLRCEKAAGEAETLARAAAREGELGLGVGGDASRLVLVLAAAPGRPYLAAAPGSARAFAQASARVAARRAVGSALA